MVDAHARDAGSRAARTQILLWVTATAPDRDRASDVDTHTDQSGGSLPANGRS
ncbi:hypothetical protein [Pseudonocardia sp. TMWB2A]|uniref:hypothetical protein n=1 Tax=Pseudonocardia sp. TMWB2A TaxID=687430 RepID=UPI00307F7EC6